MTTRPLVSAVIPAYNAEAYLHDAIASALVQTYAPMEVVVVDDGSTDATPSVVAAFGEQVRYLRQDNAGVSVARNRGAAEASGDLIAFLDADDVWSPTKTQRQVELMVARPDAGLCYSGLTVTDTALSPLLDVPGPPCERALRNTLLMEPPVISVAQTGMVRRAAFEQSGGFDPTLTTSADTDLACRLAVGSPVLGLPECLVLYRQHGAQMHLNPMATLHDMELVHARMFGDPLLPQELRRLQRRARSNLLFTVGLELGHRGQRRDALRLLARAAAADPVRTAAQTLRGAASRLLPRARHLRPAASAAR